MVSLPQTISVLLDESLLSLNRAVGVVRRRNLPIESLSVGPALTPGISRLTLTVCTDPATTERLVGALRKTSGVREAVSYAGADGLARELALIKVRMDRVSYGRVLDAIQLYRASVIDEGPEEVVVQVAGSEAFVVSFIRALEPYGVVDVARSGTIALERAGAGSFSSSLSQDEQP
jgi:acetolactate synthase-1/3 small subunit